MVALENCLDHLKMLEQADTAILGIEGFVLDNGSHKANLDAIADFSSLNNNEWAEFIRTSHDAAKNFINAMMDEKSCDVFEFTVSEREENTRN